jgi:hypothetical protein
MQILIREVYIERENSSLQPSLEGFSGVFPSPAGLT